MPQLDKVTFLSQFFWLCIFYLGLYYILLKYFLPKISRILALRRKKMNLSQVGLTSLHEENLNVRKNKEQLLSNALSTSRKIFQDFFSHTNTWLENNQHSISNTHYQTANTSYIDYLGETSLSHNVLLYHASNTMPEKLAVKILMEKMKTLKNSPLLK
jgi:hypothetical protein